MRRRSYLERVHGSAPIHYAILSNSIDSDRFRPDGALRAESRREMGVAKSDRVAIMVARLHQIKDLRLFLAVARLDWAEMRDARFWLVGGVPQNHADPRRFVRNGHVKRGAVETLRRIND